MHDVLSLVTGDMSRHVVEVKLPGQEASSSLVLIEVGAKAKMVDVLAETYGEAFTAFHRKLAEKIYGTKEADLVFGVFFKDKEMMFAFSRDLADYGQGTKTVNFKGLDEVLVEKIPTGSGSPTPPEAPAPAPVRPRPPFGGGSMVVRYHWSRSLSSRNDPAPTTQTRNWERPAFAQANLGSSEGGFSLCKNKKFHKYSDYYKI